MTSQESWSEAILSVLREANEPLDYREIANLIEKSGRVRALGETTVAEQLSFLVREGTVTRGERGAYLLNGMRLATATGQAADGRSSVEPSHPPAQQISGAARRRTTREIHKVVALGLIGMIIGFVFMAVGFIGLVTVGCPKFSDQFPPVGFACNLFFILACIGTPMSLIGLTTAGVVEVATTWRD